MKLYGCKECGVVFMNRDMLLSHFKQQHKPISYLYPWFTEFEVATRGENRPMPNLKCQENIRPMDYWDMGYQSGYRVGRLFEQDRSQMPGGTAADLIKDNDNLRALLKEWVKTVGVVVKDSFLIERTCAALGEKEK